MEHVQSFFNWMEEEGKDAKTIQAYKTILNQFATWCDGTGLASADEIKPVDVKQYVSYMKHTLDRKQATINKTVAGLKTFFSYLVDNKAITDNPMTRIKIQRIVASCQRN